MRINHHVLLVAAFAGCSARPPVSPVRFANAPAVEVVDDRKNVATAPARRDYLQALKFYDGMLQRRLTRALEVPRPQRAHGVNAVDEVPDSTWFTNRLGIRDLTIEQLQAGPITIDSPELHKPWTIHSTKTGGTQPGLVFTDARGIKFLMKFDSRGLPEMETAAQVIVGKLLWACGYNVPEDFVVYFSRTDLLLAANAVVADPLGDMPLDDAELARRLTDIEPAADGRIRAVASRWVPGTSVGGHPVEGVRSDDPNDRIPHELRRDLRGAFPIFSWLQHGDIQEGNFLDTWIEDPRDRQRHYLEHYMIDFGDALGVMALRQNDPRRGDEYIVDLGAMARSLVTLGMLRRSWEGRKAPALRGVGLFARNYNPGDWKPDTQVYLPLQTADRVDKFWGTKILMRFTRDELHAIVETGRLTDPRSVEYLTDTLVARQRATARYWFSRVNPLDRWRISEYAPGGPALCFDDLLLTYGLAPAASSTRYLLTGYGRDGTEIGWRDAIGANVKGRTCARLVLAPGAEAYTIVKVQTKRSGFVGTTFVHVARDPVSTTLRVIGIWRD